MSKNKKYLDLCKKKKCFDLAGFETEKFNNYPYKKPSSYFNFFWNKYENFKTKYKINNKEAINNSYNGDALEIILAHLFDREGFKIEKMDEEIKNVKYVKPDFLIKGNNKSKFFISAKVSIRERWKQADWEATKFKKKYPSARCILIMNDEREYLGLKSKINDLFIDDVVLASSADLDDLIKSIKKA